MGRQRWGVALSLNTRENCASLQEVAGGPHQQGSLLRLSFSGTECGLQPTWGPHYFLLSRLCGGWERRQSIIPAPLPIWELSGHKALPFLWALDKEGLRADLGCGHKGDAQILSNQGRSTWESHLPGEGQTSPQVSHGAGGCSEPSRGGPDARRGGLALCYLPHFSCQSLGL